MSRRPDTATEPERALHGLAELLRTDGSVISPLVRDSDAQAALGELVAAGPRAAPAPGSYSLLIEATREGYLLHYGEPRIIDGADPDLALLAGDYLYATGLERLAALGDLEAVRELSDLISLSAQIHDAEDGTAVELAAALWLSSAVAVACGPSQRHEQAKEAVRSGDPGAGSALWGEALECAREAGIDAQLGAAGDAIGFAPLDLPNPD